jgi:hypothetical protein
MTLREYRDARTDHDPRRDESDRPPVPAPRPPAPSLDHVHKNWVGPVVAIVVAVCTLVDVGTRIAARNDTYVQVAAFQKAADLLDKVRDDVRDLKLEVRDSIGPARQATANALAADARSRVLEGQVAQITRALEGYNRAHSGPGRPSPFPLQD